MKKIAGIILFVCVFTINMSAPAFAQKNPDRVTPWNRFTDFFATVGKDKNEKQEIIKSRKKSRRAARQFKQRQKKQKKTQKKMIKQQKEIMGKIHTRRSPHGRGGVDAKAK